VSELRRDPVTGRTVIVAPERAGAIAWARISSSPRDPAARDRCPFCDGHEDWAGRELLAWRPHGLPNGPGWQVRVVANRLPALRVESQFAALPGGLLESLGGLGAHEVVIDTPDHDATIGRSSADAVARMLWAWRERMRDLRRDLRMKSFLVVKNVGVLAGATEPHPHSQLVALPFVPIHQDDEVVGAGAYFRRTGRCVFCDVMAEEISADTRVIGHDDSTMAFNPFASRVPFETWVTTRVHHAAFEDLTDHDLHVVAVRLQDVMARLEAALADPASTLLLHSAPVGIDEPASYHWHIEIIPRLGPVPGLAWDGGIHINTVPPEKAAEALRQVIGGEAVGAARI
jgi:UDPglucose--hexose-1-phosphate uridylyltransferase